MPRDHHFPVCLPVKLRLPSPSGLRALCACQPRQALFAGLVLLCSGCAHTYEAKVDAVTMPHDRALASYKVRVKNSPTPQDDLRIQEAEKHLKTALSGKGLYEAPKEELADMIVELDYGISPPRARQEQRTEPIYQTVPGRVYTQTVQVGTDARGNPIYQRVTYQDPPTTEYIGDRVYYVTVITYDKHLSVTAYDNKPGRESQPPQTVWRVNVSSDDESKDLREYIPVLAAASIDYIGTDTSESKTVKITAKDDAVTFVKKGL